ncbi:hypothetical protein LLEC1_06526 [Akanthomyces lecanii]|uniref:FYVE-type domain-containing protein n=1 Tax=Cordyceps confragosa TaxID=2714763 RepID=A0A179IBA5_CORDF|nr:hypothetical protein LLEC1_06526 [Akanthomyces lecanii]
MAAQLIMPTLPSEQHQSRHFLPSQRPVHTRSQSYSLATAGPRFQINTDLANSNSGHYASTPPSPRGHSGTRSNNIHSSNAAARPLPPTRKHWKPDTESSLCDDPLCKRSFTYFNRRHHCRKCGNIFCDSHSSSVLPLDQDANFNPRAVPSRTCNHCFEQVKARHSRNNSQSSGSDGRGATATAMAAKKGCAENEFNLPTSKDIAASVPRDWNWSTF